MIFNNYLSSSTEVQWLELCHFLIYFFYRVYVLPVLVHISTWSWSWIVAFKMPVFYECRCVAVCFHVSTLWRTCPRVSLPPDLRADGLNMWWYQSIIYGWMEGWFSVIIKSGVNLDKNSTPRGSTLNIKDSYKGQTCWFWRRWCEVLLCHLIIKFSDEQS